MTVSEIFQVIGVVLLVAFYMHLIYRFGLERMVRLLELAVRRLYYGPDRYRASGFQPQKHVQTQLCKGLHDTAIIEIEVYERVLSTSIIQHLETCRWTSPELKKHLLNEKKAETQRSVGNIEARETLLKGGAMQPGGHVPPVGGRVMPPLRSRMKGADDMER